MPITSTSKNYQLRTVDLSIFPTLLQQGVSVSAMFSTEPLVIAGPALAAQRFVVALLTPKGFYRSTPGFGSDFVAEFSKKGVYRFPQEISQLFNIEAAEVVQYLADNSPDDSPLDEQIDSVISEDYQVSPTKFIVNAVMTMENKESFSILLPVAWTL